MKAKKFKVGQTRSCCSVIEIKLKNMALNNRYFYDQQEMGLCDGKLEYLRYRMHCSKRKEISGLSPILKKGYGTCQRKRIHCFHIILWNRPCPHKELCFIVNDNDITNHDVKTFKTEGRKLLASRPLRQKGSTLP